MNEYIKQADEFLKLTGTKIQSVLIYNGKYFDGDTLNRDVYSVNITRKHAHINFKFGQSINDSEKFELLTGKAKGRFLDAKGLFFDDPKQSIHVSELIKSSGQSINKGWTQHVKYHPGVTPSNYTILSALTKYDPGTFENFCSEFGYDTDSKKAEKTYNAVVEEWKNVQTIWSEEEIEELQEIQ